MVVPGDSGGFEEKFSLVDEDISCMCFPAKFRRNVSCFSGGGKDDGR